MLFFVYDDFVICGCDLVGTAMWPLYGVSRWPFFRDLHTMKIHVSLIGTRAVGRYIADGRC